MTDFKLVSLNVRGLRSINKRKALFMWLTKQKADIVFLQETYSSIEDGKFWNTQWKGKMLFSHGSHHSKGTLVLIKQGLDFEQKSVLCDPNGRFNIKYRIRKETISFSKRKAKERRQNNSSSCIRKLKLDDEKVTTDPLEILGEIKSFYSNLYQSHGSNNESDILARFLENPSLPKLDEDKKELCEGGLTYNECYRSLLTFQTGKAPGNDGLTRRRVL